MCVSILFLLFVSVGVVHSANILGVFLFPSFSHQQIFQPIWQKLSLKGHQVTVLTPNPINNPNLTNLTEIKMKYNYDMKEHVPKDFLSKEVSMFQDIHNIFKFQEFIALSGLNNAQFVKLIADQNKNFDLILLECINPALYGLSARFQAPIICVSSLGALSVTLDAVGNPSHPVLYEEFFVTYNTKDLSLLQKLKLVLLNLWSRFWYHVSVRPRANHLAKKTFGEIPDVRDLEQNISMFFLNVNPFLHTPRPNVPAIIELGHVHIKPAQPLPKDLQNFLDEAEDGAVFFSLGTIVTIEGTALERKITEALSRLPYKVILKWNCNGLLQKFDNILCKKWLPQQDILAHPNVKVFVTHGGLHSVEEAISREVPLVGLPFMVDQPMNVQRIVEIGIGIGLDPARLTTDELTNGIIEVAKNPKYKKKIQQVSKIVDDQSFHGVEMAVWWTEYVIKHKGALHLRSPITGTSWFFFLLLDVFTTVIVAALFVISCIWYVQRKLKYC